MKIYNPPRVPAIAATQITINVETVIADKQLTNTSAEIQDLINPTSTQLNLYLPSTPVLGKSFLIINEPTSIGNFFTNNSIVFPGDRYEIVFQGDRWLEL